MAYIPDATAVDQPPDNGVKAQTAPAEFRTLKLYIRDVILAGLVGKAPITNPMFTGNVTANQLTVNGSASFNAYAYGTTPPPGDSSKKLATTEFLVGLALGTPFPGATSGKWKEVTSDGTTAKWGTSAVGCLSILNGLNF